MTLDARRSAILDRGVPAMPRPFPPRMARRRLLGAVAGAGLGLALPRGRGVVLAQDALQPPVAEPRPETIAYAGVDITDPYGWLEDPEDPEVIAYLDAENAYREAVMAPTRKFQKALYKEMLGRIQETDVSVPVPLDGWFYYSRTEEGLQYEIYARKQGSLDAPEEILFDVNTMLRTDYIALLDWSPSTDHRYIAYVINETGGDEGLLRVRDTETGEDLPDEIYPVWGIAWANVNTTLYYVQMDEETLRPSALYRHTLGDDQADDALIYAEEEEYLELYLSKAKDRSFIFLQSYSGETAVTRYISADDPEAEIALPAPLVAGVQYSLEHYGDDFLMLTNADAPNFKLMTALAADPANWDVLVPHSEAAYLESMDVLEGHLALYGRGDALTQIWVRDMATGEIAPLTFEEEVYEVSIGSNWDYETSKLRIDYTSFITPYTEYDVDLKTGERTLLKQQPVLGLDPDAYVSERVWAPAPDGAQVPISLVRRRDSGEGPHPMLLFGYGAYGYCWPIEFDSNRLSLLDRGVTFALAQVRGGTDLGDAWYRDGKLLHKKNTFSDFIACAEHLVAEGYTTPDRLVGNGLSAGGLLITNVANARPDLFAGIVAEVPWTDVVRTMLDPTIPLVTAEYDEWGNPEDPEYRDYMWSYSPYDNIVAQEYSAMLVTAGLEDDRVMYWDPAKWTAKLRATKTDDKPLLLRMNMGAGHGGESGRYDYLREIAHDTAFILLTLGVADDDVSLAPTAAIAPQAKLGAAVQQGQARPAARIASARTRGRIARL